MKCPFCGSTRSTIKEKEPKENHLLRRRVCRACGLTYSTYEVPVPVTLMVEKSESEHPLEPFNRTKLVGGILLAFDRDKADERAVDIAGRVMRELMYTREPVVSSRDIGRMVKWALLERDEMGAELRFAILHEDERLSSIEKVLEEVDKAQGKKQRLLKELKAKAGPPDVCPFCESEDTSVITTRLSPDNAPEDHRRRREFKPPPGAYVLRRRRECKDCGERYTSHEMTWAVPPLMVIKSDGRREPFDYRKLAVSIQNAWGKREVDEDLIQITRDVTHQIAMDFDEEVPSWDIGRIVLRHLRDRGLDMALVRYMLRHRGVRGEEKEDSPRDPEDILTMLKEIRREKDLLKQSP